MHAAAHVWHGPRHGISVYLSPPTAIDAHRLSMPACLRCPNVHHAHTMAMRAPAVLSAFRLQPLVMQLRRMLSITQYHAHALPHTCRYAIEGMAVNRSSVASSAAGATTTSSPSSSNPILRFLSTLFASERNSIANYGVDPTFLPSSGLYEPSQVGREEWYYSKDAGELSATGTPYGFYHRPMQVRA